jgi:hypothetical protein
MGSAFEIAVGAIVAAVTERKRIAACSLISDLGGRWGRAGYPPTRYPFSHPSTVQGRSLSSDLTAPANQGPVRLWGVLLPPGPPRHHLLPGAWQAGHALATGRMTEGM